MASGTWRQIADVDSIENAVGTAGIDQMFGNAGPNTLGYVGDASTLGVELIDGRGDKDTADFSRFDFAVWVDLAFAGDEAWTQDDFDATDLVGTFRRIDNLNNIENLMGTTRNDLLRRDSFGNIIDGHGGDDLVTGAGGNDVFTFSDSSFSQLGTVTITGFSSNDGEKTDLLGVSEITDFNDLEDFHIVDAGGVLRIDNGSGLEIDMTRGGACGVCVQKTAEAEALVAEGIGDVMVSNQVTGPAKIARLVALTANARILVCVDDASNIDALSRAMDGQSGTLEMLVEIEVGNNRCGVEPGAPALALAQQVAAAPGLSFAGLQAYNGSAQHIYDPEERRAELDRVIALTAGTVALLAENGLGCDIVAGAGTGSHPFEAASGVYNELQCGSYIFIDADYGRVRTKDGPVGFENALFVLTTAMSVAGKGRAVCDAGHKAASIDSGMPVIWQRDDLTYGHPSDEHDIIADPGNTLRLNDRLWLIPGHCDPTVNLHDRLVGVRGGRVECLWPVTARGMGS